jgi:hypothetical protein
MAGERVSPGMPIKSRGNPLRNSRVVNDILAAKDAYLLGLNDGREQWREPPSATWIKVRNDSNATRNAGEAMELTGNVFTELKPDAPWMTAALRAGVGPFGILRETLPDDKIGGYLQLAGHCMALVDILDADHTHCYVKTSDANPQSNFGGPWRILWKPTGTGNAQRSLILLGDPCYERKIITDATLTAGSSAACSFYVDGVDKGSETVYFNWMENGVTSVASGKEGLARWMDDEEKWVLVAAECA